MRLRARVYRRKIIDKDDKKTDNNNNNNNDNDNSEENKPVITDTGSPFQSYNELSTQSKMNLKHNIETSVSYTQGYGSDDNTNTNTTLSITDNTSKSSLSTPNKNNNNNKNKNNVNDQSDSNSSLNESINYDSDESDWESIKRNTHLRMMETFLHSGYQFPSDQVCFKCYTYTV